METPRRPAIDPKQLRKTLLTWGIVGLVVVLVTTVGLDVIWREGIIRPMLNSLLFLYTYLGHSFIIAIAAFTILLRLLTLPLSIQSVRTQRKTTALQPRMAELQKKYAGNRQKLVEEQQRLYKEAGASPLSGCLPTLIQFPIWIGLYQSITSVLADTPVELMRLGINIYPQVAAFTQALPIESRFLWLNLAQPDPTRIVLPILVGGTMYLQQRLATRATAQDPQQASMNNTMQFMMPLMFGYFTMQFASGLALYFVISNVVGIIMQWAIERREGPVTEVAVMEAVTAGAAAANNKDKSAYGRKRQRRKKKR